MGESKKILRFGSTLECEIDLDEDDDLHNSRDNITFTKESGGQTNVVKLKRELAL